ncbi:MAG TPA: acyl carrier protein [Thermotoga sp.]|nr:MAG: acyl carrier protein [Thermotogota bacterium]RKX52809.1 MAG: acyl carrier protein [Thermotoga sp.]RKX56448.1 MAG: acyl carrier protein [Thermotoga sp.]HDG61781.1 acyl carrier protein [Thermotoga sp.]
MERSEILEKVRRMVAEKLGIDLDDVKEDANIIEDLGADSLDLVDIVMYVEDTFGIRVEDEELEKIKTLKDIVDGIAKKLEGGSDES